MDTILFQPYALNQKLTLANRIIMAPMTRAMADDSLVPTEIMADYYARRADAGLIITEGIIIRPDGKGHDNVPGIFTQDQIDGWRHVVDKVHARGGIIFAQLWHVGRVSHPYFLNGRLPVSPSTTRMTGAVKRSPIPGLHYGSSYALSEDEIHSLVRSYQKAAESAMKAGFDGIELHGANGYLIDQFLHYHTNQREDQYGGTPENMSRFLMEVIEACQCVMDCNCIGVRLSPGAYLNEMVGSADDKLVFKYLLEVLDKRPIAYIHTGNFDDLRRFPELDHQTMTTFMRNHYKNTLIACGGYDIYSVIDQIDNHAFDLIALGKPFIANPRLIERVKQNLPLEPYIVSMLNELY